MIIYMIIYYIVALKYVYVYNYNNYICLENHLEDQVLHGVISSLTTAVCQQFGTLNDFRNNHGQPRLQTEVILKLEHHIFIH